ncbi:hypothetical protein I7I48_10711 [Histoplasma ohiense]|nr:hypothetical protein I7I48_10711 [Histoplasma ohiense (nom. inval.)]
MYFIHSSPLYDFHIPHSSMNPLFVLCVYISYTHSGTSTSTSSMQALPACQSHNKVDTYLPNLRLFHAIGLNISIGILAPNSVKSLNIRSATANSSSSYNQRAQQRY